MDVLPHPMLLLPTLIEAYLARCTIEGKSPHTVQGYRESLTRFSRCLQEDGVPLDPNRIRPDPVIAYLARHASLSPATRHPYFRGVRYLWNWLRAAGYTINDVFPALRDARLARQPHQQDRGRGAACLPTRRHPPTSPAPPRSLLSRARLRRPVHHHQVGTLPPFQLSPGTKKGLTGRRPPGGIGESGTRASSRLLAPLEGLST